MKPIISKSLFLQAAQCRKNLYYHLNNPELKAPVTPELESVFNKGLMVEDLAKKTLWANGFDVSKGKTLYGERLIYATQKALKGKEDVLFEAGFAVDFPLYQLACRVDTLTRAKNGMFNLIEITSSTNVENKILDLAYQYYVLEKCGIKIHEASIVHLNKNYERKDFLDTGRMFKTECVTNRIKAAQVLIQRYIDGIEKTLKNPEVPDIGLSTACIEPFKCPFYDFCHKDLPKPSVLDISRLYKAKKYGLIEQGIVTYEQIPRQLLNSSQLMEIDSYAEKKIIINVPAIKSFLSSLQYPLVSMDFESHMPAIPPFRGMKAWNQLCFQFSAHEQKSIDDEKLIHTKTT